MTFKNFYPEFLVHFRAAPLDKKRGSGYNLFGFRSLIAQLAERSAVNRNVVGSSPTQGATSSVLISSVILVRFFALNQPHCNIGIPVCRVVRPICRSGETNWDSRLLKFASHAP